MIDEEVYAIKHRRAGDSPDIGRELNKRDKEGWDLVNTYVYDDRLYMIFKKKNK